MDGKERRFSGWNNLLSALYDTSAWMRRSGVSQIGKFLRVFFTAYKTRNLDSDTVLKTANLAAS